MNDVELKFYKWVLASVNNDYAYLINKIVNSQRFWHYANTQGWMFPQINALTSKWQQAGGLEKLSESEQKFVLYCIQGVPELMPKRG
jgi:hypothetical protein